MEIGGYIELDRQTASLYHDKAVALNCGRAAIEYLIRAKKIKKIYLPFFCCNSIAQPCRRCGIEFDYYHIDENFRPLFNQQLAANEYIYIVNYYGQLSNVEIEDYKNIFNRVIIDNAQAFFQKPVPGVDTLYTCRKFFGVSDGGFLYTDVLLDGLQRAESFERLHYILGRFERTGAEFYHEASDNNERFEKEPLMLMSKLTDNLLRAIDYSKVEKRRTENFTYLHQRLCSQNQLKLAVPSGAFMYPFYCKNGSEVRKMMQLHQIYVPTLWPDVLEFCEPHSLEFDYAQNILPLPIDQRYGAEEMDVVLKGLYSH